MLTLLRLPFIGRATDWLRSHLVLFSKRHGRGSAPRARQGKAPAMPAPTWAVSPVFRAFSDPYVFKGQPRACADPLFERP
jgi:hypothetical protein